MEQNRKTILTLKTERKRDGTERDRMIQQKRKELSEGPHSRMERNDLKKFRTCPVLCLGGSGGTRGGWHGGLPGHGGATEASSPALN